MTTRFLFLAGDLNNDGAVDFNDLVTFAQHEGLNSTNSTLDFNFDSFGIGDFNNDGQIDFNDLVILTQNYGINLPSRVSMVSPPE